MRTGAATIGFLSIRPTVSAMPLSKRDTPVPKLPAHQEHPARFGASWRAPRVEQFLEPQLQFLEEDQRPVQ